MKRFCGSYFLCLFVLATALLSTQKLAAAGPPFVVTNDDLAFPFLTGVSFFTVGANGLPVFQQQVQTGTYGIGGGYFGMNRLAVLNAGNQQCVYASEARDGNIVGVAVSNLTVASSTQGSAGDTGKANGIGLATNPNYLYASFSDANNIGTFAVQSGCGLLFIADTSVSGSAGGVINGMAVHGNMLIATYTDGSIESFNISGGTPISNGDKQNSTATVASQGATYANSIDITRNGHYAIFGDTSTALGVEVSDISSGRLSKTHFYQSTASIGASNVILSPDESLLYVVNTQGATISALFFDKNRGKVSTGCTSPRLAGLSQNWSYLGTAALMSQSGNGGGVYVAEFGAVSGIATVTIKVTGHKCSLQEMSGSPTTDPNTTGLLSINTFPPRSF
jgi:6-phosphogluconolactonase (cycloisomerase 2 family)